MKSHAFVEKMRILKYMAVKNWFRGYVNGNVTI